MLQKESMITWKQHVSAELKKVYYQQSYIKIRKIMSIFSNNIPDKHTKYLPWNFVYRQKTIHLIIFYNILHLKA